MSGDEGDEVGSVEQEALKLLNALQDWATERHVATGGPECAFCPVCQVIHTVRGASPEVRTHLATAASSLLQAAAGLLATRVPESGPERAGVQKIHLDDEEPPGPGGVP